MFKCKLCLAKQASWAYICFHHVFICLESQVLPAPDLCESCLVFPVVEHLLSLILAAVHLSSSGVSQFDFSISVDLAVCTAAVDKPVLFQQ